MRPHDRISTIAARSLAVVAVAEIALFAILAGADISEWRALIDGNVITTAAIAVPFAAVGALVIRRDRHHVLGWIFVALGQLAATATLSAVWADRGLAPHGLAVALAAYLWLPALLLAIATLTLYFPDGRLPSERWRPLAVVAWSVVGVGTLTQLFIAPGLETMDATVRSPLTIEGFDPSVSLGTVAVLTLLAVACFLAGMVGLIVRAVRSERDARPPLWWMIAAFSAMLIGGQLGPIPNLIGSLALPLALGVATLRYGLYDGDRWRGRTAIHGIATVVIVAFVAVPVGMVAAKLAGGEVGAVLAAVVIGLGFAPAQQWARRGIDRLFYGDRMQPYAALTGLGQRLENALSPEDVLPALVTTVSRSLNLPYTAVTLANDDEPAARIGEPGEHTEKLPLVHGGDLVGTLEVGTRAGQRVLDAGDEALLKDLAVQAGASVGAVLLNRELVGSRERLIVAREEERRRIRRDLHDGIGPTLAGVALGLDAAHRAAGRAGLSESLGLETIHADVQHGLDDLKRIIGELRPAALDDLGLLSSLRDYASSLTASGRMRVSVECAGDLPGLPAAVELVAYFIAREAMNNAARHSLGSRCDVCLRFGEELDVQVVDDGRGVDFESRKGVGLGSMVERARELGGECLVESRPGGGTLVHARIPVHA